MQRAARLSAFALICAASIACGSIAAAQDTAQPDVPKWFAEMLDSSTLPRMPGSQELFASKATTSFVVREQVAAAAEATQALLGAEGWQQYVSPFSANAQHATSASMRFKKGRQALSVFIVVAPAQGGATSIQYTPLVAENDLPFPRDATNIEFAPDRPHLNCFTAETVENTLAFFARELGAMGYAEWSVKTDARKATGERAGEITRTGGYAYFVHDEKKPLQLLLTRADDKVKVELKAVPKPLLEAQARQARAVAAQPQMVDVQTLPRPAGAYMKDEDTRRASSLSVTYMVPLGIAGTKAAISRLLVDEGWVSIAKPLDPPGERHLNFKKGGQSISLFFMTDGDNTTRSGISMSSERLYRNVPFPPGVTDVVYDHRRPLLDAIAPGTVESLLEFFRKELTAMGWSAWSAADAARYPNARLEETIEGGVRAYFTADPRDRKEPIQVSLGGRKDGRVDIEVRVPAFARPQNIVAGKDADGLPTPEHFVRAGGRTNNIRRELTADIAAERDVVLAFYRREMAQRGWKEDARGPVENGDDIVLNFSKPDTSAVLTLGFEYDLTTVSLVQKLPDAVVQARIKAQRDAEEKLRKRAEELMRGPPKVLEAMTEPTGAPIPLPDTAEKVKYDSTIPDVKFTSDSAVREIAAFYRTALKQRGFNEEPAPIDDDKMASLTFRRAGKYVFVSIHKAGERTDVRSHGPGLLALAAEPRKAVKPAQAAMEELEAEDADGFPIPKKHTLGVTTKSKFHNEREVTVPASLNSVLAFYRRELGKLGWKEETKGAVIRPERVTLSFATPVGPGGLILGRANESTTVKISQRNPQEAIKAGLMPKPGQARVVFASAVDDEASVTINRQTLKVAPGVGKDATQAPKLDLPPGNYTYTVKVPGKPPVNQSVSVSAGQAWGILIGPGGALPLQVY